MKRRHNCVDCLVEIRIDSIRCVRCARRADRRVVHGRCRHCGGPAELDSVGQQCAMRCREGGSRSAKAAYCSLDGLPLAGHPYCQACTVLTGPAHAQQMAERGVCGPCLAAITRMAKRDGWRAA